MDTAVSDSEYTWVEVVDGCDASCRGGHCEASACLIQHAALPGCTALWRQEEYTHSSTVQDLQTRWLYKRTAYQMRSGKRQQEAWLEVLT